MDRRGQRVGPALRQPANQEYPGAPRGPPTLRQGDTGLSPGAAKEKAGYGPHTEEELG